MKSTKSGKIFLVYDIIEAVLRYIRNLTSDLSLVALHIIKAVTGENITVSQSSEKLPPSARRFSNAKNSSTEPDSTDSEDERPLENYEPSLVKEISKGVISYFQGENKAENNEENKAASGKGLIVFCLTCKFG